MTSNLNRNRMRNNMRARAGLTRLPAVHVEEALQRQFVEYFRVAVPQTPEAPLLFAVPNGEARDKVTAAKLTGISAEQREYLGDDQALQPFGLGVLPGVVDLVLMLTAGRTAWIEIKRPADKANARQRGRLNRMQRLFRTRTLQLGHSHHVLESVDEFAELLISLGVKVRARWWGPEVVKPGQPPRLPA